MLGINIDNIDKLIKLNNLNCDELQKSIKNMIIAINEFDECYSGRDIEHIFDSVVSQKSNLSEIIRIVSNYSTILTDVKTSYEMQDQKVYNIYNEHKN